MESGKEGSGAPTAGGPNAESSTDPPASPKTPKKPKQSRWTAFKVFVYDGSKGAVFGRTGTEWLRVTIFYIIFYACLISFLYGMIELTRLITVGSGKRPSQYGPGSLIMLEDPHVKAYGVRLKVIAPAASGKTGVKHALKFKEKDQDTWMKYVKDMQKAFKDYPSTGTKPSPKQLDCSDPAERSKKTGNVDEYSCLVNLSRSSDRTDSTAGEMVTDTGTEKVTEKATVTATVTPTTSAGVGSDNVTNGGRFVRDDGSSGSGSLGTYGSCGCDGPISNCSFGYPNEPCIAVGFSKLIGWTPMPEKSDAGSQNGAASIKLICNATENVTVVAHQVYPKGGLPTYYFPYPGKFDHYLEPFFMIQVKPDHSVPDKKHIIKVNCTFSEKGREIDHKIDIEFEIN